MAKVLLNKGTRTFHLPGAIEMDEKTKEAVKDRNGMPKRAPDRVFGPGVTMEFTEDNEISYLEGFRREVIDISKIIPTGSVPKKDYDILVKENGELKAQVEALQKQLETKKK